MPLDHRIDRQFDQVKRAVRQLHALPIPAGDGSARLLNARPAVEIHRHQCHQHQHRTGEREQEKLDGRVFPSRSAPHADQEIHGKQHDFPENIEQEKVERNEYPQHPRLKQQEQHEIRPNALVDLPFVKVPTRPASQKRDHRRQNEQREPQSVDAQEVFNVQLARNLDPRRALDMVQLSVKRVPKTADESPPPPVNVPNSFNDNNSVRTVASSATVRTCRLGTNRHSNAPMAGRKTIQLSRCSLIVRSTHPGIPCLPGSFHRRGALVGRATPTRTERLNLDAAPSHGIHPPIPAPTTTTPAAAFWAKNVKITSNTAVATPAAIRT